MKPSEITVGVCVEELLHKALRETVEHVWREHGIRVTRVEVKWGAVARFISDQIEKRIDAVRIETES